MKEFTKSDLYIFYGRDGIPAFIAYSGRVYDVTESFLWKNGKHQVFHHAGMDLTEDLQDAPHGADLLERVRVAGILISDTDRK